MKKYSLMILALLFCASSAFGYSYSWTGTYDPVDIKIGDNSIWNQQISLNGFNQSTDTVTYAKFVFYLYDDSSSDSGEKGVVRFSTYNYDTKSWIISGTTPSPYEAEAPNTVSHGLLNDGSTYFDLYADYGDFRLDRVVLYASGNRDGVNPVPEPATMLLLGLGLVGLAGFGRKRFNS